MPKNETTQAKATEEQKPKTLEEQRQEEIEKAMARFDTDWRAQMTTVKFSGQVRTIDQLRSLLTLWKAEGYLPSQAQIDNGEGQRHESLKGKIVEELASVGLDKVFVLTSQKKRGRIDVDADQVALWLIDMFHLAKVDGAYCQFNGAYWEAILDTAQMRNLVNKGIGYLRQMTVATDAKFNERSVSVEAQMPDKRAPKQNYVGVRNGVLKIDRKAGKIQFKSGEEARKFSEENFVNWGNLNFKFNEEYLDMKKPMPKLWADYIDYMWGKGNRNAFVKFLASCFSNEYSHNLIVIGQGVGGTGKTYQANLLLSKFRSADNIVKDYIMLNSQRSTVLSTSVSGLFAKNDKMNFNLQFLYGMSVLYDDDFSNGSLDAGETKKATGDTEMTAPIKNSNMRLSFFNHAKIFMNVNEKVRKLGFDSGMARRLIVMKCLGEVISDSEEAEERIKQRFPEEELLDSLDDLYSWGVVHYANEGLKRSEFELDISETLVPVDYMTDLSSYLTVTDNEGLNGVPVKVLEYLYRDILKEDNATNELYNLRSKAFRDNVASKLNLTVSDSSTLLGMAGQNLTESERLGCVVDGYSRGRVKGVFLNAKGIQRLSEIVRESNAISNNPDSRAKPDIPINDTKKYTLLKAVLDSIDTLLIHSEKDDTFEFDEAVIHKYLQTYEMKYVQEPVYSEEFLAKKPQYRLPHNYEMNMKIGEVSVTSDAGTIRITDFNELNKLKLQYGLPWNLDELTGTFYTPQRIQNDHILEQDELPF